MRKAVPADPPAAVAMINHNGVAGPARLAQKNDEMESPPRTNGLHATGCARKQCRAGKAFTPSAIRLCAIAQKEQEKRFFWSVICAILSTMCRMSHESGSLPA